MTEGLDADIDTTDYLTAERARLLDRIHEHAGGIARELARLEGGDYGRRAFRTDRGEWTVKYEAGVLEFLLFDPNGGEKTYVISTKQPPEPAALAEAMSDYAAFVKAYNAFVDSQAGMLDDIDPTFPAVRSAERVVVERDRIVEAITAVCTEIAQQCYRYEGTNYGLFSTTVDGTRWELKWEEGAVSYLRVGGENGVYLLSQYGQPAAQTVRRLADDVPPFVTAFNAWIDDLDSTLTTVSFESVES